MTVRSRLHTRPDFDSFSSNAVSFSFCFCHVSVKMSIKVRQTCFSYMCMVTDTSRRVHLYMPRAMDICRSGSHCNHTSSSLHFCLTFLCARSSPFLLICQSVCFPISLPVVFFFCLSSCLPAFLLSCTYALTRMPVGLLFF